MNIFAHIKAKVSIDTVVGEYTTLKRAGSYFKGPCPFHQERTASFTVTPHREIFYCFGCHAGGDVIAFIARIEQCSQIEAAQHLIDRYNLDVPTTTTSSRDRTASHDAHLRHTALCTAIGRWCHEQLAHNPQAQAYCAQRAITPASIARFGIGFFPGGAPARKQLLLVLQREGFMLNDLITAKIYMQGKHGPYSPFEQRIIFPIADHLGRICGFGGRVFLPDDNRPKYYNSHDHQFFAKSTILFGLDHAKRSIQKAESVYLVEGYLDCILMAQHGLTNTVATLGTACTEEHLKLLSRYAHTIISMYDGDKAGTAATLKLGALCWQQELNFQVALLPKGQDPASYLAQGGHTAQLVQQDLFSFYTHTSCPNFAQQSVHDQLNAIRVLIRLISNLKDPLQQELLLKRASTQWQIPLKTLMNELRRLSEQREPKPAAPTLPHTEETSEISAFARKLFCVILKHGVALSDEELRMVFSIAPSLYGQIISKWATYRATADQYVLSTFFTMLTANEQAAVASLFQFRTQEERDATDLCTPEAVRNALKKRYWSATMQRLKREMHDAQRAHDSQQVGKLMESFTKLKREMQEQGLL